MLNGQGSSDGASEQLFQNNNPEQVNEYLKEQEKPPPYAPQFYPTPGKEPCPPGYNSINQSPIPGYPYVQQSSPGARAPQEVIVLYNPPPAPAPRSSYAGHIILSCVVFWCCGWMCGLVAFALASKIFIDHVIDVAIKIEPFQRLL